MAILKPAALANASENFAIADSNNLHGGWKNHLENIGKFTGLSDLYVDINNTGADWTGGDAWGLYKPWSTLVYVEDARPLIEITDTSGLTEGIDYFDISLDGTGVYYGPDGSGSAQPGIFIYFGNENSDDGAWNGDYVNTFTTATVDGTNQATLTYWKNINEIVTDPTLTQGLVDLDIFDNYDAADTPSSLSEVIITDGGVTGDVGSGYTVNFGTGQNILDLIHSNDNFEGSGGGSEILAEAVEVNSEHKIAFRVNPKALLDAKSLNLGTDIGGDLNANGYLGSLTTYGDVSIAYHLSTSGETTSTTGSFSSAVPSTFTNTVLLSGTAGTVGASAIQAVDNNGDAYTSTSVVVKKTSNNQLGLRTLDAIAFTGIADGTYVDNIIENHLGGVDDDLITVTEPSNDGEYSINVQASPTLASSGSGGSAAALQLGPDAITVNTDSGATDVRLLVRGSAEIVGDLTVQGSLTTTSQEDVTFEDSTLTLNFLRDADGSPTVSSNSTTGNAGIEAWYGYDTSGNENSDQYSRPYIRYEYTAGGYGKWYLANSFDSTNSYSANSGYILTSIDVNKIDPSVTSTSVSTDIKYHNYDVANDTLQNLTTPYGLLTPFTLTGVTYDGASANVTRKFGRVATVSYGIQSENEQIFGMFHYLGTSSIYVVAIVEVSGSGGLPPAGSPVMPKYKPNGLNQFDVKVLGSGVGDTIKFLIMG
jgi:hypothetical protein